MLCPFLSFARALAENVGETPTSRLAKFKKGD